MKKRASRRVKTSKRVGPSIRRKARIAKRATKRTSRKVRASKGTRGSSAGKRRRVRLSRAVGKTKSPASKKGRKKSKSKARRKSGTAKRRTKKSSGPTRVRLSIPRGYKSHFRRFLRKSWPAKGKVDAIAIVEIELSYGEGPRTRVVNVRLGKMTRAQAKRLTDVEVSNRLANAFRTDVEIVGVLAVVPLLSRTKRKGKTLAPRRRRRAKK